MMKNKDKITKHKCGKVVFMGEPNVGKSSLLNALVGEDVSIVTDMAGTTRESVRGFLTSEGWQIIFLDTPGMDNRKDYRDSLAKYMGKSISNAVAECDVICYVLEATDVRDEYIQKIRNLQDKKPLIVVVNKVDRSNFEKLYPHLAKLNGVGVSVIPVSAKSGENLNVLRDEIIKFLPEGSAIFDADEYTDQSVKKMCGEIIRGALINNLQKEIPHGLAVRIVKFAEANKEVDINAEILCKKPSHKPIIIGKKGAVLKAVGIEARKKIEELVGKHVRLNTHVLVKENWRESGSVEEFLG